MAPRSRRGLAGGKRVAKQAVVGACSIYWSRRSRRYHVPSLFGVLVYLVPVESTYVLVQKNVAKHCTEEQAVQCMGNIGIGPHRYDSVVCMGCPTSQMYVCVRRGRGLDVSRGALWVFSKRAGAQPRKNTVRSARYARATHHVGAWAADLPDVCNPTQTTESDRGGLRPRVHDRRAWAPGRTRGQGAWCSCRSTWAVLALLNRPQQVRTGEPAGAAGQQDGRPSRAPTTAGTPG